MRFVGGVLGSIRDYEFLFVRQSSGRRAKANNVGGIRRVQKKLDACSNSGIDRPIGNDFDFLKFLGFETKYLYVRAFDHRWVLND